MKLELKHIAPYFPYGLKAQDLTTKEVRTVTLLHFTYDRETVGHNHLIYEGLLLSKHLPILHRLPDITKPIEYYGKRFVPIDKICDEFNVPSFWAMIRLCFIGNQIVPECPLGIYEMLLKWHFDIHGLIDAGLAIDVNTLEINPYK